MGEPFSKLDVERVKGIEPSYEAWEAAVLPLNYTRGFCRFPILWGFQPSSLIHKHF